MSNIVFAEKTKTDDGGNLLTRYTQLIQMIIDDIKSQVGFTDPVTSESTFCNCRPKSAVITEKFHRRLPLSGIFVDTIGRGRGYIRSTTFGGRLLSHNGIQFVEVYLPSFFPIRYLTICERKDAARLYRLLKKSYKRNPEIIPPPVMRESDKDRLWNNTIGFLKGNALGRTTELGGRAKRGIILTGEPGNGKTTALRWLRHHAEIAGLETKTVSPSAYSAARRSADEEEAVAKLFTVNSRGIIFFDDMDVALRDRETTRETDDQTTFLTCLDGIDTKKGIVFVFTTNCQLGLIDKAFRRPGRIDLTIEFGKPDAALRRQLLERWHKDVLAGIKADDLVSQSEGFSFAELDEVKNLLVMGYTTAGNWDLQKALRLFQENRVDFNKSISRKMSGFQTPKADIFGRSS